MKHGGTVFSDRPKRSAGNSKYNGRQVMVINSSGSVELRKPIMGQQPTIVGTRSRIQANNSTSSISTNCTATVLATFCLKEDDEYQGVQPACQHQQRTYLCSVRTHIGFNVLMSGSLTGQVCSSSILLRLNCS